MDPSNAFLLSGDSRPNSLIMYMFGDIRRILLAFFVIQCLGSTCTSTQRHFCWVVIAMSDMTSHQCAICLEELSGEGTVWLPCSHAYHKECMQEYETVKRVAYLDLPCACCKVVPNSVNQIYASHEQVGSDDATLAPRELSFDFEEAAAPIDLEDPAASIDLEEAAAPPIVYDKATAETKAVAGKAKAKAKGVTIAVQSKPMGVQAAAEAEPKAGVSKSKAEPKDGAAKAKAEPKAVAAVAKAEPKAKAVGKAKGKAKAVAAKAEAEPKAKAVAAKANVPPPAKAPQQPAQAKAPRAPADAAALAMEPETDAVAAKDAEVVNGNGWECCRCLRTFDMDIKHFNDTGGKLRCCRCNSLRTLAYRDLTWSQVSALTDEQAVQWFNTAFDMPNSERYEKLKDYKVTNRTGSQKLKRKRGESLPLNVWAARGYDPKIIKRDCKP